jgi:hypothetical protein
VELGEAARVVVGGRGGAVPVQGDGEVEVREREGGVVRGGRGGAGRGGPDGGGREVQVEEGALVVVRDGRGRQTAACRGWGTWARGAAFKRVRKQKRAGSGKRDGTTEQGDE